MLLRIPFVLPNAWFSIREQLVLKYTSRILFSVCQYTRMQFLLGHDDLAVKAWHTSSGDKPTSTVGNHFSSIWTSINLAPICYLTTPPKQGIMKDQLQNNRLKSYTEEERFLIQERHRLQYWPVSPIASNRCFGGSGGLQSVSLTASMCLQESDVSFAWSWSCGIRFKSWNIFC